MTWCVEENEERGIEWDREVVGSVHRHYEAWVAHGASPRVLQWIREGVPLRVDQPETLLNAKTGCNRTMTGEQAEWVRLELSRLVSCGAVDDLGERRPDGLFISPIRVVEKKGRKKYRLVYNQRKLNGCLAKRSTKFDTLATLFKLACRGWWIFTFGLENAYHQVRLAEA